MVEYSENSGTAAITELYISFGPLIFAEYDLPAMAIANIAALVAQSFVRLKGYKEANEGCRRDSRVRS